MQVESALATQNLKPTIDAIKRLYGDNKDKVQRETSALYKKSGVNPTAGEGLGIRVRPNGLPQVCAPSWSPAGKIVLMPLLFPLWLDKGYWTKGTSLRVCDRMNKCMEPSG